MKKALAFINVNAGAVAAAGVEAIIAALHESCADAGWRVEILSGEAMNIEEEAKKTRGYDALISVGGDGTHLCIAEAAIDLDAPLLALPAGTVNLFCRDLGLPMNLKEAIATGLAARPRRIDVGRIETAEKGARYFLNNIVFGAYAELAEAREGLRDGETLDDMNFALVAGAQAIAHAADIDYVVRLGGEELVHAGAAVVISNNAFTEAVDLIPRRARIDKGRLAIYFLRAKNGLGFMARLIEFLSTAGDAPAGREGERCQVAASNGPTIFTLDGEPEESAAPVAMSALAGALPVLAP
ncbi:MAG: diacylglycerol kinase family protein [Amphiplicatus sp.]